MVQERLQKVLARAGLGSRRACEALITAGRVAVDGKVVRKLGTKVDPTRQEVTLDGEPVRCQKRLTLVVNKPRGVVSTNAPGEGRLRVIDLVPFAAQRLYPVGRLDVDSEGLILLTNEGMLAQVLTHPRYEVPKTYVAEVEGRLTAGALDRLRRGMRLAEGHTGRAEVEVLERSGLRAKLRITIRKGLNRQVRRMLARVGLKVRRLKRVAVGSIQLGDLKPGKSRPLTSAERRYIDRLIARARAETRRTPGRTPR